MQVSAVPNEPDGNAGPRSHSFQQWIIQQTGRRDRIGALARLAVSRYWDWDNPDELRKVLDQAVSEAIAEWESVPYEGIPGSWKPVDLSQVDPHDPGR